MKKYILLVLLCTLVSCSLWKDPKDYPLEFYDPKTKTWNWETYEWKMLCPQNYGYIYNDFLWWYALVQPIWADDFNRLQIIDSKCNRIWKVYYSIYWFFTDDIDVVWVYNPRLETEYLENWKEKNTYNFMNKKWEILLKDWVRYISSQEFSDGYIDLYTLSEYDKWHLIRNIIDKKWKLFFDIRPHEIYSIHIENDDEYVKQLQVQDYWNTWIWDHHLSHYYDKLVFDWYIYYKIDEKPEEKDGCQFNRWKNCKWYKVKENDKTKVEFLWDEVHPKDILKKDPKLLKHLQ